MIKKEYIESNQWMIVIIVYKHTHKHIHKFSCLFLYMGSHFMLKFAYPIELKFLVRGFMSTVRHGICTKVEMGDLTYNTKYRTSKWHVTLGQHTSDTCENYMSTIHCWSSVSRYTWFGEAGMSILVQNIIEMDISAICITYSVIINMCTLL